MKTNKKIEERVVWIGLWESTWVSSQASNSVLQSMSCFQTWQCLHQQLNIRTSVSMFPVQSKPQGSPLLWAHLLVSSNALWRQHMDLVSDLPQSLVIEWSWHSVGSFLCELLSTHIYPRSSPLLKEQVEGSLKLRVRWKNIDMYNTDTERSVKDDCRKSWIQS